MQMLQPRGDAPTALELQSNDMPYGRRGIHRHRVRDALRHELDQCRAELAATKAERDDLLAALTKLNDAAEAYHREGNWTHA